MTDITERLRTYVIGDQLYHPMLCSEAADEIERLRAVLKEIVDCWYLEDDSVGTAITKAENLISE